MTTPSFPSQPMSGFAPDGYLSRDGLFYACGYQGHRQFGPRLHAALFPEAPLAKSTPQTYLTEAEVVEFTQLYPGRDIPTYFDKHGLMEEAEDFFCGEGWVKISSGGVIYFTTPIVWASLSPTRLKGDFPYWSLSPAQVEAVLAWADESQRTELVYNTDRCSIEKFLERQRGGNR